MTADTRDRTVGDDHWGGVLGLEMLESGPERVVARLDVQPRHHQPYGILHGYTRRKPIAKAIAASIIPDCKNGW